MFDDYHLSLEIDFVQFFSNDRQQDEVNVQGSKKKELLVLLRMETRYFSVLHLHLLTFSLSDDEEKTSALTSSSFFFLLHVLGS